MKRTNTVADVLNTGTAKVDVGDGVVLNLPLDGVYAGEPGPAGAGVPAGGSAFQVIRKDAAGVTTEWASLSKADLGLGNVSNTSDADKPLSSEQVTALAGKEPSIAAGAAGQFWGGEKAWVTPTKADVGLDAVDNTADADKPVSAPQATELGKKVAKGALLVNVLDRGATGDGVTDDTTAIQAVLTELGTAGGGIAYFPKTTAEYKITATLTHNNGVRIVGQSKGVVIGAVGNFPLFKSSQPGIRINDVEISNLTINRYGSGSTTPIIDWTGVSHSNMRDVAIRQGTARGTSTGVLLGLESYYNEFTSVQVREVNVGFRMQDAANGNRFNGGTAALFSDNGYVVDNSNANAFLGASAEQLGGIGFHFLNGAKMNQVIGCRIESMPVGVRVEYHVTNPAFNQYLMGNAFYMGEGQVEYDSQTDNVIIDRRMGYVFKNLYAADQRTFVAAYKSTAQGSISAATWTKVLLQNEDSDLLSEFTNSTFTAKTAGIYSLTAQATFAGTAGANNSLGIYKNGALYLELGRGTANAAGALTLSGGYQLQLAVNDTLEMWIKTDLAATNVSSGRNGTALQISRHG